MVIRLTNWPTDLTVVESVSEPDHLRSQGTTVPGGLATRLLRQGSSRLNGCHQPAYYGCLIVGLDISHTELGCLNHEHPSVSR